MSSEKSAMPCKPCDVWPDYTPTQVCTVKQLEIPTTIELLKSSAYTDGRNMHSIGLFTLARNYLCNLEHTSHITDATQSVAVR